MKMHQFAFVQKVMSNTLSLTPRHPVDVKQGTSEYVDSPLQYDLLRETISVSRLSSLPLPFSQVLW